MTGEPIITVVGNLTADPELRFTPSGAAVANFTVASTPRNFDKQANEWKEGETLFMRCSVWREMAEFVTESLHRGDRVIATGRLVSRSWQTQEGENRTSQEMQVDEVGPSLRYATATVTKAQRQGGQQGGQQQGGDAWGPQGGQQPPQQGQGGAWGQPQGGQQPQADPWATQPPGGPQPPAQGGQQPPQQGGGWGQPPF